MQRRRTEGERSGAESPPSARRPPSDRPGPGTMRTGGPRELLPPLRPVLGWPTTAAALLLLLLRLSAAAAAASPGGEGAVAQQGTGETATGAREPSVRASRAKRRGQAAGGGGIGIGGGAAGHDALKG